MQNLSHTRLDNYLQVYTVDDVVLEHFGEFFTHSMDMLRYVRDNLISCYCRSPDDLFLLTYLNGQRNCDRPARH